MGRPRSRPHSSSSARTRSRLTTAATPTSPPALRRHSLKRSTRPHHDGRRLLGRSVGLWAAVDVHGDGERQLPRQRDADRHDHVLLRLDAARHGYAQRRDRQSHRVAATRRRQSTPSRRPTAETPTSRRARARWPRRSTRTATTTSVVSSTNPSVYGQSVTFTATVDARTRRGAGRRPARSRSRTARPRWAQSR